jgi:hypothetical protein
MALRNGESVDLRLSGHAHFLKAISIGLKECGPQSWGLNNPEGNSKGFRGVNPSSVTTARPGGILFEISPLENTMTPFGI